eukprot:TRINITY_DN81116_c0_g1_i1.p1 TRINITY_DN81116_c0_g1~~TRINITY_DN81116_c0_g1_i1.p1  ORF type:complete len:279 (-),score=26.92 TRINITY_DN81116_c0_g1_i1:185-1021(-)
MSLLIRHSAQPGARCGFDSVVSTRGTSAPDGGFSEMATRCMHRPREGSLSRVQRFVSAGKAVAADAAVSQSNQDGAWSKSSTPSPCPRSSTPSPCSVNKFGPAITAATVVAEGPAAPVLLGKIRRFSRQSETKPRRAPSSGRRAQIGMVCRHKHVSDSIEEHVPVTLRAQSAPLDQTREINCASRTGLRAARNSKRPKRSVSFNLDNIEVIEVPNMCLNGSQRRPVPLPWKKWGTPEEVEKAFNEWSHSANGDDPLDEGEDLASVLRGALGESSWRCW